jgi:hypothetical protein
MRKLDSYVKKYGKTEGTKMYRRLQREAALASAHARHKKAIAKGTKKSASGDTKG